MTAARRTSDFHGGACSRVSCIVGARLASVPDEGGHPCSSVLIRGNQRPISIVGARLASVLESIARSVMKESISAHQCSSVLISAHQCSSVPISAHQCPSVPISAHQCPSEASILESIARSVCTAAMRTASSSSRSNGTTDAPCGDS